MIPMMSRRTAADGTETWMELVSQKLLRRAMDLSKDRAANGHGPDCSSIPKLALAAQVSTASVGFLLSTGKSRRQTCSVRMAEAIADALGWDVDELFLRKSHERTTAA